MRHFRVGTALSCLLLLSCGSVSSNETDAASRGDAAQNDGSAGCTATCEGSTLTLCDDQGNESTEECALGCHSEEARCNELAPSNDLAAHLDSAESAPAVSFDGSAVIDTDAGTITDDSGSVALPTTTISDGLPVDVFVVEVKSLTANEITVTGSRALAIVSAGAVVLNGSVLVRANLDVDGPGALVADASCRGGDGTGSGDQWSGGGGGGFGARGGRGGTAGAFLGGTRGEVSGNAELVPLRGGCAGGHGGGGMQNEAPESDDPGGGGGAIQIVSASTITIKSGAFIDASGGPGKSWTGGNVICTSGSCFPGQGGGSGGGILLEALEVIAESGAGVVANGGGGSCDSSGTGTPGQQSDEPAPGQACDEADRSNAGDGAAGGIAATNGEGLVADPAQAGGGGGGPGRIRINLPTGASFSPAAIISPAASVGALKTR